MKKFLALSFSDAVFIMLINVKMPTIVGILTFMSRINFVLSWVELEKSFIASGQVKEIYTCITIKILLVSHALINAQPHISEPLINAH